MAQAEYDPGPLEQRDGTAYLRGDQEPTRHSLILSQQDEARVNA